MTVELPVVNGSSGTWGGILNAALTDIDNRVTAATQTNAQQDQNITNLQSDVNTIKTNPSGKVATATSNSRPTPIIGQVVIETDTGYIYYGADVNGTPTPVPIPGSYVAKLRRTSTQNFGNNSQGALNWTEAGFDRLGGWSNSAPSRYTAKVPGMYEFFGMISFDETNTGGNGQRQTFWALNGTVQNGTATAVDAIFDGPPTTVSLRPVILKLSVGDYVEAMGLQNSGATVTTSSTTAFQPSVQVIYRGFYA